MVYFVCSACQDTLKLRALDTHRCGASLSCVDCSADFSPHDAQEHNKCITEAEKYEKSLYRPSNKASKPDPQVLWTNAAVAAADACTDKKQKPLFARLADYPNIPRKLGKFLNFARNSLGVRDDALLTSLFHQIDEIFRKSAPAKAPTASAAAAAPAAAPPPAPPPAAAAGSKRRRDDDDAVEPAEAAPVKIKAIIKQVLQAAGKAGMAEQALISACIKTLLRSGDSRVSSEREAVDAVRARLDAMRARGKVLDAGAGSLTWRS